MTRSGSGPFPPALAAFLLVCSLALAPVAQAQTDSEAAPEAPELQPGTEPPADPAVGLNDEPTDEEAEAAADAASQPVQATLERFVPSEQISEDNSVAYPNDI